MSHEIQRSVPAICSYRHPVVLVMEMGGDTHSFRSITYMDDVRVLLRHRGSLVNKRTLRVPRGEEGRREKKRSKKHDSEWGWERVGVRGTNFGFLLGTVMLPRSPAYICPTRNPTSSRKQKKLTEELVTLTLLLAY